MAENTKKKGRLGKFFRDLGSEFKKITWPTWQQTWKNTLVVLATVAIFAVVIWVLDFGLTELRDLLFTLLGGE